LVDLPRFLPKSHTDWLRLAEDLLQNICNENTVEIITYATLLPLGLFVINHFPHREIFELVWNDSLLSRLRWPSVHFKPTMAGGNWLNILRLTRAIKNRLTIYQNTQRAVRLLNNTNNNVAQPMIVRERIVPQLGRDLLGIHVDTQLLVKDWNYFGFRQRVAYRILNPNSDLNSHYRFPSQITMELALEKGDGVAQFSEEHSEITISNHTSERERDLIILSNQLFNKIEDLAKQSPFTHDSERESLIISHIASSIKKLNPNFEDSEGYAESLMPLAIHYVSINDHNGLSDILNLNIPIEHTETSQAVLANRQHLTQRNQKWVDTTTSVLTSTPGTTLLVGTANWVFNYNLTPLEVTLLSQIIRSGIQITINRIPFQEMVGPSRIDGTFSLIRTLLHTSLNHEMHQPQLRHAVVNLYVHRVNLLQGRVSNREIANSISDVIRGELQHIVDENPALENYLHHRAEIITEITDSLTRESQLPTLK
jgi:hypothetical protein